MCSTPGARDDGPFSVTAASDAPLPSENLLSPASSQHLLVVREMQRGRKKSMVLVDGWIDVQERVSWQRGARDCEPKQICTLAQLPTSGVISRAALLVDAAALLAVCVCVCVCCCVMTDVPSLGELPAVEA